MHVETTSANNQFNANPNSYTTEAPSQPQTQILMLSGAW